jgi:hypothetical protein
MCCDTIPTKTASTLLNTDHVFRKFSINVKGVVIANWTVLIILPFLALSNFLFFYVLSLFLSLLHDFPKSFLPFLDVLFDLIVLFSLILEFGFQVFKVTQFLIPLVFEVLSLLSHSLNFVLNHLILRLDTLRLAAVVIFYLKELMVSTTVLVLLVSETVFKYVSEYRLSHVFLRVLNISLKRPLYRFSYWKFLAWEKLA